MNLSCLLCLFMLSLLVSWTPSEAWADFETETLDQAMNTLDHFMVAGTENDARRAAGLLVAFDANARRAEYDTRLLFRRQKDLLSHYVSISSDLYGFQIQKGFGGTSVELEGGIETESGVTAEFKARLVYKNKRWWIDDLEID